MCGIFVVIPKNSKRIDIKKCKRSLYELKRRGPDWSFFKVIDNIFFGQTVLSMTGKKKLEISQHISSLKNFFLTFNGEIYNYKDLISNKNKNSKIISDTKVLVDFFDKIEPSKINNYLDGMYAYVAYDKKKKDVYFSRDPQGEKSLYKFEDSEYIILSSEIRSILLFTGQKQLDLDILKSYFFSRHFIQFNKTIFKNINNLEPGDLFKLNMKNKKVKKIKKFSIREYISKKQYRLNEKKTESQLVNELDALLKKSLKEMLPEKRNFCSIISGGVDSSLISMILSKISRPKKFISLNHIRKDRVSNKVKKFENYLMNKVYKIKVSKKDYLKNYLEALKVCCSPINSHDFPGKLILAKKTNMTRSKAIFGGDGADEFFGGYSTYTQKIKNIRENNSNYTKIIKPKLFDKDDSKTNNYSKKINSEWKSCLKAYNFIKNRDERNRLAMMLMDSAIQLPSVGLRGCDLMSMNHSVEPRSVFLRKPLMKFALNLPLKFKLKIKKNGNSETKILLKKLYLRYFPKKLLYKKQGFSGFPNEMGKFLGTFNKFKINKLLKVKNFDKKIRLVDNAEMWKIFNLEFFLRESIKGNFNK